MSVMNTFYNTVALLPMKAHSARVQGKNFRLLAGRPLFRWILDSLLELPEIEAIVINTDARGILAENGLISGGRIIIRDRVPELCGDFTSMNLILGNDIDDVFAERYIMTHTTNPLLSGKTIRAALVAYEKGVAANTCDSLFSANRCQSRLYRTDGSPVNHDPRKLIRTQDLEPWFEENSNLYIFSRRSFSQTLARIGAKPLIFETPRIESVDIDDQQGWDFAEKLAMAGNGKI